MEVKLQKIEELPNALHPNNIEVGVIKKGEFIAEPKVGECFWVGNYWRTSTVQEIINKNHFKTCNSIYEWTLISK